MNLQEYLAMDAIYIIEVQSTL